MTPNIRHLYAFREVAIRKSIHAASSAVFRTQPAITQAMSALELHFGCPLLRRSNVGITLTAFGEILLLRVQRALSQLREGALELSRSNQHAGREYAAEVERLFTSAQLRALVAVVEHRNFNVAARAEGVAAPSIHRAARELERNVGVALFEKTSFGTQPTREARRLARRVRLAIAEIAQAREEIHSRRGGSSGGTVVGALPLARSRLLPSALVDFTRQHPRHEVSILEGTYENLISGLREGRIDWLIGALRDPVPFGDLMQEHLFDDPLAVIMRAGHPLRHRKNLSVRSLARFPWVAPLANSPLRARFNDLFGSEDQPLPSCPIQCNSLIVARGILLESDSLMLLSAHQVSLELKAGLLVAAGYPCRKVSRSIGLTRRVDWSPTPVQQRLIEALKRQVDLLRCPQVAHRL